MNEIVTYNNYLNTLHFKDFSAVDLNVLMTLCAKVRDCESDIVVFTFGELRKLTNYSKTSNNLFIEEIKTMNRKLNTISCEYTDNVGDIHQFNLFPVFDLSPRNKTLTVQVNNRFRWILNGLTQNFTSFELKQFVNLNSKYTKNLYRLLKQYKSTQMMMITIDEFRMKMDCPENYTNKKFISKILNPAISALKDIFEFTDVKVSHENKPGSPIKGFEFRFKPVVKCENIVDKTA